MVFGWVVAGHQAGAATAAMVAGTLPTLQGNYIEAFTVAGASGVVAAFIALFIARGRLTPSVAAPQTTS